MSSEVLIALASRPTNELVLLLSFSGIAITIIFYSTILFLSKLGRMKPEKVVRWFMHLFHKTPKEETSNPEDKITININNQSPQENSESKEVEASHEPANLDQTNVWLMVIDKSVKLGIEVAMYKEVTLIKSQMTAAELRVDLIEGMIVREYLEALYKEHPNTNVLDNQSYRIFSEILHNRIYKSILNTILKAFRENHLTSYSEEGFKEYIEVHVDRLVLNIKLSVNEAMPSFLSPGRDFINQILDRKNAEIVDIFQDIFTEGRSLALKTENIIAKKKRDFDEEIKRITGVPDISRKAGTLSGDPYDDRTSITTTNY